MQNPQYIQVAIDVPLLQSFTYKAPDNLFDGDINIDGKSTAKHSQSSPLTQVSQLSQLPPIGSWVYVPFGKQKIKLALVVGHNQNDAFAKIAPEKILPWQSVVADEPMPVDWVDLVKFASIHYHYPLGQVIAQAFPLVVRKKIGQELPTTKIIPTWVTLAIDPTEIKNQTNFNRQKNSQKLLSLFIENQNLHWQQLKEDFPQLLTTAKNWLNAGYLNILEGSKNHPHASITHKLNDSQQKIVDNIWGQYQKEKKYAVHLIQGVTGSGKTEIYFSLAQKALEIPDKQVMILMPEIALTPQMITRVLMRFPQFSEKEIAILHSSIAEGARRKAFNNTSKGIAKIIIGTRLAIFTPLKNPGIIIVDEEHDSSYKQSETAFSYSGRDLAIYRANKYNIPIILGSATPSLESYHSAISGRYNLHTINNRAVIGSTLPQINTIDLRGIKLINGLSEESLNIIKQTLDKNEQILIFLNRRGYAPIIFCQACGWMAGCESCSANLTLHRADNCLRCHHCGYSAKIPHNCPQCGNPDIEMRGIGTQKLEEFFVSNFPKTKIMRIDRDSSKSYKTFSEQQKQIAEGKVDLIIGTQMMAKGHDFPKLSTVIVLNADFGLFAGDFRGIERTFSLLTQVSGRAGRHFHGGKVFIQTACPEHKMYQYLKTHDFQGFAENELSQREQVPAPPFCYQALLRVEATSLNLAISWLKINRKEFIKACPKEVTVYDAIPMRLSRKADWERLQMLIESRHRPILHKFLTTLSEHLYSQKPEKDIKWWLDISPLEI